jgi:hypothetical protein
MKSEKNVIQLDGIKFTTKKNSNFMFQMYIFFFILPFFQMVNNPTKRNL